MNKNCFAYKNGRCKTLKIMKCANNTCSFFKTEGEHLEGINGAYNRINSLDKTIQKNIADTYYDGKMPWLRGEK